MNIVFLVLLPLLFIIQTIYSFPLPGYSNPGDCDTCACSVKNWVCNIKCPSQKPGERQVCDIQENKEGTWEPSEVTILQTANNFCQRAQIVNEKAHLAVGNFFNHNLDLSKSLDCFSIRLGDEKRRQKITFDLIPPIPENPHQFELVIFERANGTKDGLLEAASGLPVDNYLPEAFAFSLEVDGAWTEFFYSGVRARFVEFKGQTVPDWKNQDMGYNLDFDSWGTEIEFRELGVSEGSLVTGISIINLQPGDMIRGPMGAFGEVIFSDQVKKTCDQNGACSEPLIDEAARAFGPTDYDPDIVWIAPFTGQTARRRSF